MKEGVMQRRFIRREAEEWEQHVVKQKQSGQSVKEYCEEHCLGQGSFYHWQRRLKNSERPEKSNGFVRIDNAPPSRSIVHIETANGCRLTFKGELDEALVGRLIQMVTRI